MVASIALSGIAAAGASAAMFEPANGPEAFPIAFDSAGGGIAWRTAAQTIQCTSSSGNGEVTSEAGGVTKMSLHGCAYPGLGPCESSGAGAGAIETRTLDTRFVDLPNGELGLLLKPGSGEVFAEFTCWFGLVHSVWTGALVGEITEPRLEEETSTFTMAFRESGGGGQKFTEAEGKTGIHLSQSLNGAAPEELLFIMEGGSTLLGEEGQFRE